MTELLEPVISEFREEMATTKRVFARIPGDRLNWKPHPKSMSLGQLAIHIATVPGRLAELLDQDAFDAAKGNFTPPQPETLDEINAALDRSVRTAESFLAGLSPEKARGPWRFTANGKELFTRPRIEVMRLIMFNHVYHHRGQLSVYLRLLDVPVPIIYGRSADESPF